MTAARRFNASCFLARWRALALALEIISAIREHGKRVDLPGIAKS